MNEVKPQHASSPEPDHMQFGSLHPRVLKSEDLLCGEKVVLISHRGEIYRLCETRNGKLILGK